MNFIAPPLQVWSKVDGRKQQVKWMEKLRELEGKNRQLYRKVADSGHKISPAISRNFLY
jgi:hypothetical protein